MCQRTAPMQHYSDSAAQKVGEVECLPELPYQQWNPAVTFMEMRALGVLAGGVMGTKMKEFLGGGPSGRHNTGHGSKYPAQTSSDSVGSHFKLRSPLFDRLVAEHPRGYSLLCQSGRALCSAEIGNIAGWSQSCSNKLLYTDHELPLARNARAPLSSEPIYDAISSADMLWGVTLGAIGLALQSAWNPQSTPVAGAATFATATTLCAFWRRDQRMRARLVTEEEARYDESKFVQAGAVKVHYFEAFPVSRSRPPQRSIILVHGFGASARSFHACMQPLADAAQARVLAVDMPGFGLTSRPHVLEHYDTGRMLTLFSTALGLPSQGAVVLVGHSLGALAVIRHLLSSPSPPAAAVLVSPALSSLPSAFSAREASTASGSRPVWGSARDAVGMLARVAQATLTITAVTALQALTPLLALGLRTVVYSQSFWRAALAAAYDDSSKLSEATVEGYRRGAWVRRWEAGVLNFIWFRATCGMSSVAVVSEALMGWRDRGWPAAAQRPAKCNVPLMVVHGAQDTIIPCGVGRCAAEAAGQTLVEIDQCGHCPMEEQPAEFVRLVAGFVLERSHDCR